MMLDTDRFAASAGSLENRCQPLAEVRAWLAARRADPGYAVTPVPLAALDGWRLDESGGALVHGSGGFFRVGGVRVERATGPVRRWDQPLVEQPGVGTLGFLVREIDGLLHFLVQAKMEPGSPGLVQLAPTLQATVSNAARLHRGREPSFARSFLERRGRVVAEAVLPELGAYFSHKRNLNVILEVDAAESLVTPPGFRWLTLGELGLLAREDHVVNMCARSVLALVPRAGGVEADEQDDAGLRAWLVERGRAEGAVLGARGLLALSGWGLREGCFADDEDRFVRVMGVHVEASDREVAAWGQPLLHGSVEGTCGMLAQVRGGALRFLVQARFEPGAGALALLAPTVTAEGGVGCPYEREASGLAGWFGDAPRGEVLLDCRQSREGGRFWRTIHRYQVVRVPAGLDVPAPESHRWVTPTQLRRLLTTTEAVHLDSRELLAMLVGQGAP